MDDFSIWWYIIAAVLYFLTNRKKKKKAGKPTSQNRPQKRAPAKSFEDLLKEISEGPSEVAEEERQEAVEIDSIGDEEKRSREAKELEESTRLEGERRHFADDESRKIYQESIKMAEGADLAFEPSENYRTPRLLKDLESVEEEDEWTIADEIRDGLSSSEAKKAVIYSEILNRKY